MGERQAKKMWQETLPPSHEVDLARGPFDEPADHRVVILHEGKGFGVATGSSSCSTPAVGLQTMLTGSAGSVSGMSERRPGRHVRLGQVRIGSPKCGQDIMDAQGF